MTTIGSAIWSILAPVFVPMFMLLGFHPAFAQMIFRIADSAVLPLAPMSPVAEAPMPVPPAPAPTPRPANPLLADWTGPYGGVPAWDQYNNSQFSEAFTFAIDEQRRQMDWVVVRNRTGHTEARNMSRIDKALGEMSKRVGFRVAKGLSERVIYRELFPSGLTLLDKGQLGDLGTSHLVARQELRGLVANLRLPQRGGDMLDTAAQ